MASRQPAPKLLTDYHRPCAANVADHVAGNALPCLYKSLHVPLQSSLMIALHIFLAQPNWATALANPQMALENLQMALRFRSC